MMIVKMLRLCKKLKKLSHLDPDDLLHKVGLGLHRSTWHYIPGALGLFCAGAAFGAGVAWMMGNRSRQKWEEECYQACHEGHGYHESDEQGEEERSSASSARRE